MKYFKNNKKDNYIIDDIISAFYIKCMYDLAKISINYTYKNKIILISSVDNVWDELYYNIVDNKVINIYI